MMAISLWQPWASLVACGAKRVETRTWQPPASLFGERIAIHAAQTQRALAQMTERMERALDGVPLTLGAIIGTVRLVACEPITTDLCNRLSLDELAFGDYTAGRFAWLLSDARQLTDPVMMAGRLGFFDVSLP